MTEKPDPRSPLPLYVQCKQLLRRWIRNAEEEGALTPNQPLPGEWELCERYGVSRITIKRALDQLAAEGLIYQRQGLGTFLAEPRIPHELSAWGHSALMRRLGLVPSHRVVEKGIVPATKKIAAYLQLEEGQPLSRMQRICLGDGQPFSISTSYVSQQLMPDLLEQDLTQSLLEIIQRVYRYELSRMQEFLEPIQLFEDEAETFGLGAGSLGLLSETVLYAANDLPIEYNKSVLRSDRFRFTILHRMEGK